MSQSPSDQEFIELFLKHGPEKLAKILGISERTVYYRRAKIEKDNDRPIKRPLKIFTEYPMRIPLEVRNGVVLIGSDAHYWPGIVSTAHKGFVKLAGELPDVVAVVLNGDCFDGARVSRFAPTGFSKKPNVREEIDAVDERTYEIVKAAPKAEYNWLLGNHDFRFESVLASKVPEFENVNGFALRDQFPLWTIGLSLWINNSVVIKHRFKGGIHATHNNTLWSGRTIITGHLHSLKVTPFSDYNGTRFGVDTGTLADPDGPQFEYIEDAPINHRSGFIVLTFQDGLLLWPEIVHVISEGRLGFRGKIISV